MKQWWWVPVGIIGLLGLITGLAWLSVIEEEVREIFKDR